MRGKRDLSGPAAPQPANVLIVDDHEPNLIALEALFEPLCCNVVRARSGEEALALLCLQDFAVVLLDVMMPGLDGFATAELISSRPATRGVPIIFLSAVETRPKRISLGYAQGAVDYLVKPVDPDILRSKVAVFVELFLQRQALRDQTELARQREREALENRRLYESERGARARAEAIARAREEIIAVVSHDLRNPMSAIATKAMTLRLKLAKGQTDGLVSNVELIERSLSWMETLVSDLLDTARIQSGSLSVELGTEAVIPLVHQISEQLRPVLSTKNQTLQVVVSDGQLSAKCDRERVLQVFSNLLGNASKFSPAGAKIRVEVKGRPGEVLCVVSDEGPGIPREHLPHIFEPYWQAARERKQGFGLGLAIVKGIIEGHSGRLWVESQLGAGSRFFFTLPAVETASVKSESMAIARRLG